jgi:hypothetical protein
MPSLPAKASLTGSSVTEGQFKAALDQINDYLAGLLGTGGGQTEALNTLGAATPAQLQTIRDATIAAQQVAIAARDAALAAWTAAVAANPAVDSSVRMNPRKITANLVIPDGYNATTNGPIEASPDVTVTGLGNSTWRGI